MAAAFEFMSKDCVSNGAVADTFKNKEGETVEYFRGEIEGFGFCQKVKLTKDNYREFPPAGTQCRVFGEITFDKLGNAVLNYKGHRPAKAA